MEYSKICEDDSRFGQQTILMKKDRNNGVKLNETKTSMTVSLQITISKSNQKNFTGDWYNLTQVIRTLTFISYR